MVAFQFYLGIGFASCMILHGLWYDDRFEFTYSQAVSKETGEIERNISKFELDNEDDTPRADATLISSNEKYASSEQKYANESATSVL